MAGVTQKEGYVWILPGWYTDNWYDIDWWKSKRNSKHDSNNENGFLLYDDITKPMPDKCNTSMMEEALNGEHSQ